MQIGVESARAVENRRIFVVDTDEIIRAALQFMLHDENEAHEIDSIEAAVKKAADWPPDLVLVGQSLLQGAGPDALTRLREALPQTPVVLVGHAEDATVAQAVAAASYPLIALPLRLEPVREAVDRALGRTA
jgi:DNA-binding NtrC family response regulator